MVHDTENLTFSVDSARTLRGFRTDNQRIPCGTISKFYSYNDILDDPYGVFLDPLALLRTKFAFWFLPFQTESARKIRARLLGRSAPARTKDPRPPARKFRGARAEVPQHPRGTTMEFLRKS